MCSNFQIKACLQSSEFEEQTVDDQMFDFPYTFSRVILFLSKTIARGTADPGPGFQAIDVEPVAQAKINLFDQIAHGDNKKTL